MTLTTTQRGPGSYVVKAATDEGQVLFAITRPKWGKRYAVRLDGLGFLTATDTLEQAESFCRIWANGMLDRRVRSGP